MSNVFPNAAHVARREYLVRVRGRAFRITTAVLAVAVVVFVLLPTILSAAGVRAEQPKIALDVRADDIAFDAVAVMEAALAGGGDGDAPGAPAEVTLAEDPAAAAEAVREGTSDGLVTVTRGPGGELAFEYLSGDSPASTARQLVMRAATSLAVSDRLARAGFDPAEAAALFRPPSFSLTPADPGGPAGESYGSAQLLAYIVVVLIFMAIVMYGQWVAQSVAEEKSNRVMELLVTAATPRQLLTGKVLGTAGAALTQYGTVVAAAAVAVVVSRPLADALDLPAGAAMPLPALDPAVVGVFIVFLMLGFLLYSTLYAAAGSMVSRVEDVQQAVGALMFFAVIGYFVSFVALNAPDAGWLQPVSLVPFFSPYLIPVRMLLAGVEVSEVIAALVILMATVVAAIWAAARIYSAGVLLYGQRAGLRTVLRAARVSR